ncbi:MAG: hypothetical protein U5L45_13015 [Saprospiraceae bacterium]|nr:hypothetical protein [Saprospiraceae bacterium]
MWFVFRRSRKNEPRLLPFARAKRAQNICFNQKTMFLGYVHSSIT